MWICFYLIGGKKTAGNGCVFLLKCEGDSERLHEDAAFSDF